MANGPPSPAAKVNEEWRMNNEVGVMQTQRYAEVVTSPPLPPIRQAQGRLSRGRSASTLSQEIDVSNPNKIKSERVRRLRDRIMGKE